MSDEIKPSPTPRANPDEATAAPDAAQAEAPSGEAARKAREAQTELHNAEVRRRMARQTRRSFLVGGVAALGGYAAFRWLTSQREDGGIAWPFRRMLEVNEELAGEYFLRSNHRSPEVSPEQARIDRVNGDVGLDSAIDLDAWRLRADGIAGVTGPLELTLDALKKLPRVEMTTELKCVEGWSNIVHWAGARFRDFVAAYPPLTVEDDPTPARSLQDLPPYVSMETPDGGYYVGLDIQSAVHPQTLLAYEMNGAPLTDDHGAPLRLVIPVKYGVKSLKRLARIRFAASRPADYWAERGYDWFLGL